MKLFTAVITLMVLGLTTTAVAQDHLKLFEALNITDADTAKMLPAQLEANADIIATPINNGMTPDSPLRTDQYVELLERTTRWYEKALSNALRPGDIARLSWKVAQNIFVIGELVRDESEEQRLQRYARMIELSEQCLNHAPDAPMCHLFRGLGIGRRAITLGLINSVMNGHKAKRAWKDAIDASKRSESAQDIEARTNANIALSMLYRLVPDSAIVQVIARIRGNLFTAQKYARAAVDLQPYRIEAIKELALVLLCTHNNNDGAEPQQRREANRLLNLISDGSFDIEDIRPMDPIDKAHAKLLLEDYDRACSYSRDSYQAYLKTRATD